MIFNFGDTTVDIDVEATKEFYHTYKPINDCSCTGCKNFRHAVLNCSDEVKYKFKSFGIDNMNYITEIIPWFSVNTNDERNGLFWYTGFYHVKGTVISDDKDSEVQGIFIDKNFKVFAGEGTALIPENFPEPVILISIDVYLPWVIDDENDYETVNY